jgi:hypothetical protein
MLLQSLVGVQVDPAGRAASQIQGEAIRCLVIENGQNAIAMGERTHWLISVE